MKKLPKISKSMKEDLAAVNLDPWRGEVGEVWKASFHHTYLVGSFDINGPKPVKRLHHCLKSGYWCWSNLLESPWHVVDYLRLVFRTK